ncbi:hypothetical protein CPB85DRAFT_1362471, partial [Mucidula mucida]
MLLLYHVARNSRGSLPVYSDVRNAGSRYLVYIRNVDGNVADLVNDLTTTLFPESSAKLAQCAIDMWSFRADAARIALWSGSRAR